MATPAWLFSGISFELQPQRMFFSLTCALLVSRYTGHAHGSFVSEAEGTTTSIEEEKHARNSLMARPADAGMHFELGRVLASPRLSRQGEAIAAFRSALDIDPKHSRAWHGLALVARQQHKDDEALSYFEMSLQLNPAHGPAQLGFAKRLKQAGRTLEAFRSFAVAASLVPDDWKAQVAYAAALQDRGRASVSEAEAYYRLSVSLSPEQFSTHYGLGHIVGAQDRHEEAVDAFRVATELSPANSQAHLNFGVALLSLRLLSDAELSFARAVQLQPQNVDALEEHARVLQRLLRNKEAEVNFVTALDLQPDRASAFEGLADTLVSQKRLSEALDAFRQGVSLNPQNSRSWLRMGHILTAVHYQSEAAAAFQKSTTLGSPDAYEAPLLLSLMMELQGQHSAACEGYALGVSRVPGHMSELVSKLASPRINCQLPPLPTNWVPMPVPCLREDADCWDKEQRLVAAGWSRENVCSVPESSVLAESCELFQLRQRLLRARLNHCLHIDSQQHHENKPPRYDWEKCLSSNEGTSGSNRELDLNGLTFAAPSEDEIPDDIVKAAQKALAEGGAIRLLLGSLLGEAETKWQAIEHGLHHFAALADGSATQYVHQAQNRHHMRLRPNATVLIAAAFAKLAKAVSAVLPLAGGHTLITELGAFLTNPRAKAQRWHRDFQHSGCEECTSACAGHNKSHPHAGTSQEACTRCLQMYGSAALGEDVAPLFSCQLFVTNEAGAGEAGGLEVVPGTHELGHLFGSTSNNEKVAKLQHQAVSMAGPPGTVVCYDGTLEHRGAAYPSREGRARAVLYFSVSGHGRPAWAGTALSPDLVGLRLHDLIEGHAAPDVRSCVKEDVAPRLTDKLEL